MNRQKFLEKVGIIGGGGLLLPGLFTACSEDTVPNITVNFSGKVLIIGAGSAGLMAGYVLQRYGIDFEIIEASSIHGGRVKESSTFTDFPIDLGAEWIHTDPSILATLLDNPDLDANINIINYSPPNISIWKNNKVRQRNYFSNFYGEHKFKSTTWYSYFENYVVPSIRSQIRYNEPVNAIDYSGSTIEVTSSTGNTFIGDRVIVTVPLSVMQDADISFTPTIPSDVQNAYENIYMPDGIKVFIEFTENFYPDILLEGGLLDLSSADGDRIYYNAAYGKDTKKNVLGLFTVGEPSTVYSEQPNEEALIAYILNELDTYFDGKASATYVQHISQNWSKEPFIRGSYTHGDDVPELVKQPINNQIFFAGETYAPTDTSTVHGAANAAWVAVERILANGE